MKHMISALKDLYLDEEKQLHAIHCNFCLTAVYSSLSEIQT